MRSLLSRVGQLVSLSPLIVTGVVGVLLGVVQFGFFVRIQTLASVLLSGSFVLLPASAALLAVTRELTAALDPRKLLEAACSQWPRSGSHSRRAARFACS